MALKKKLITEIDRTVLTGLIPLSQASHGLQRAGTGTYLRGSANAYGAICKVGTLRKAAVGVCFDLQVFKNHDRNYYNINIACAVSSDGSVCYVTANATIVNGISLNLIKLYYNETESGFDLYVSIPAYFMLAINSRYITVIDRFAYNSSDACNIITTPDTLPEGVVEIPIV